MNVAVIAWCKTTSRFSKGTEPSRAAATKCAVGDRYATSGLLAFSNTQGVITLDVRAAEGVGSLVHIANDLVDFT